jgi:hypothetical protein
MASSKSSCVHIDRTFGPYALYCRGHFDFTLLFEETVLTIAPLCLLLLVAPFRIIHLFKKARKVEPGPLLPLKLVRICYTLSR